MTASQEVPLLELHSTHVTDTPGMNDNEAAPLVGVQSTQGGNVIVIGVVLMTLLSFPGDIFFRERPITRL